MKRIASRIALWLGVLVLLGGSAVAWLKAAPRPTPKGQPQLMELTSASLTSFREAFNASPDRVRVVALLSPT
jgi:hypothetical protein